MCIRDRLKRHINSFGEKSEILPEINSMPIHVDTYSSFDLNILIFVYLKLNTNRSFVAVSGDAFSRPGPAESCSAPDHDEKK